MKSKLLLSTAVLLASVGISSAQNAPGGGAEHGRGVESHGAQSTPMRSEPRAGEMKGQQGAQENHGLPANRVQGEHSPQTTGQAPQREQGQREERNQPQHTERNQPAGSANQGQQPQRSGQRGGEDTGKDRTTGQAPPQQNAPGRASQNPSPSANPGANPSAVGESRQQQGERNPTAGERGQGQAAAGTVRGATLSNEQRNRIRETVISERNVPRVNDVNFALDVGTVVPESVRFVEVPQPLFAIYPQWRGDYYFVAENDIVILDSGHRIVATVPMGTTSAQFGNGSGSAMNLSSTEIREVQTELSRAGFAVEVDGVMGPRTRDALIAFQRQKGFQATGEIDSETLGALGGKGAGTQGAAGGGNQPATTGQGAPGRQPTGSRPSGNQPSGSRPMVTPQHNSGTAPPSTTGQGNAEPNRNLNGSSPPRMNGSRSQENQR